MLSRWKKLNETTLFKNNWWRYKKDEFLLSDGTKGEYHYVSTNGASMIIPVQDDGRIILVKQYRYLNEKESLEFPCGGVKDGQSYEETAIHELAEETGLSASSLRFAGSFNPYNGVTNEICRIYTAHGLSPVKAVPDRTEEFEKYVFFEKEIEGKISAGEIWDGMTIAAWALIKGSLQNDLNAGNGKNNICVSGKE
jgi:ADP-ribose pyrophosphatase